MIKLLVLLTLISITAQAADQTIAIGGGLNVNNAEYEDSLGSGIKKKTSYTLLAGARYVMPLNENLKFRTGATIEEKSALIEIEDAIFSLDAEVEAKVIYATIPLTLQYNVLPNVGFFAGLVPHIKINDYCDASGVAGGCTLAEDEKTLVVYGTLGFAFNLIDTFDLDLSYQHALTDNYEDTRIHAFQALFLFRL